MGTKVSLIDEPLHPPTPVDRMSSSGQGKIDARGATRRHPRSAQRGVEVEPHLARRDPAKIGVDLIDVGRPEEADLNLIATPVAPPPLGVEDDVARPVTAALDRAASDRRVVERPIGGAEPAEV